MENQNRFEQQDQNPEYRKIEIDLPEGGKLTLEQQGDLFVFRPGKSMTAREITKIMDDIGLRGLTADEAKKLLESNPKTLDDLKDKWKEFGFGVEEDDENQDKE